MKNRRQEIILELIERYEVQKQEDLIRLLEERGIAATQATVSRDIRELKLMKGTGDGGVHKYVLPTRHTAATPKFNSSLIESGQGAHLHFAVTKDGVPMDPKEFLSLGK